MPNPFRQRIGSIPNLDLTYWSFSIGGRVGHPFIVSYADLMRLPTVEAACIIKCEGADTAFRVGVWRGVPMSVLLGHSTIYPDAAFAQLQAADGYLAVLPMDQLERTILATMLDGEPLTPDDGAPVRLIAPGLAGYKMPKWLERIELTQHVPPGFWEARGWSLDGALTPFAVLTAPRFDQILGLQPVALAGVAYSGQYRLDRVEISVDDNPWSPAVLLDSASDLPTPWSWVWQPPAPGDYIVRVRAVLAGATISGKPPQRSILRVRA